MQQEQLLPRLNPAASIVDRLGGEAAVARMVDLSKVQVWRWMQPRSKQGTDGEIPRAHRPRLIACAYLQGIHLTEADFQSGGTPQSSDTKPMLDEILADGGLQTLAYTLDVEPHHVLSYVVAGGIPPLPSATPDDAHAMEKRVRYRKAYDRVHAWARRRRAASVARREIRTAA